MAALAGTNLIYGLGMIESGVTFDYAQLVIDDEIAHMVKCVVGGIKVSDERLAVDDIARVGSFGDFLSLDATMAHMREQSQPALIDRRVREDWEERGSTDMYQRALVRAREILETHVPEPLPEEVAAKLKSIIEAAENELGVL